MKQHLLVFDDGAGDELDLRAFVDSLDKGAQMLALDGHVCFLRSGFGVSEVSRRFERFAGSRLFFVSDISKSDYSGRMPGDFWREFMQSKAKAAAE